MKEFNFNTLKNLPVPEQWVENALAIPETEDQRPAAVLFWRKPRFIAMAASLMLVTALSLALFLTMGSKPPIAVKSDSKPDSTQIVWSTDEYGATVVTEIVVVPNGSDQDGTQPTEKKSPAVPSTDRISSDDRTSPTTPSSQSGSNPSATQPGRTPQSPTAAPQKPTSAPSPVTPDPTAAPKPIETDPPREPETDPPEEPPTESPSEVNSTIHVWLPVSVIPEDGKIYCKVISLNTGKLYGDYGEYDDERLMTRTYKGSEYWYYSYHCRQHFDVPKVFQADEVIYYIYDSEGNVLFSETTYLGSWV